MGTVIGRWDSHEKLGIEVVKLKTEVVKLRQEKEKMIHFINVLREEHQDLSFLPSRRKDCGQQTVPSALPRQACGIRDYSVLVLRVLWVVILCARKIELLL
jgi:hypothetical protein